MAKKIHAKDRREAKAQAKQQGFQQKAEERRIAEAAERERIEKEKREAEQRAKREKIEKELAEKDPSAAKKKKSALRRTERTYIYNINRAMEGKGYTPE